MGNECIDIIYMCWVMYGIAAAFLGKGVEVGKEGVSSIFSYISLFFFLKKVHIEKKRFLTST